MLSVEYSNCDQIQEEEEEEKEKEKEKEEVEEEEDEKPTYGHKEFLLIK